MKNQTLLFCGALASSFVTALALAQDDSGNRATSFQTVSGSAHQDVPGGTLLVAAYAIVLAVLVAYVMYLTAMQRTSSHELVRLEKALEKKIGEGAQAVETKSASKPDPDHAIGEAD